MIPAQRFLVALLRLAGSVMVLAILAVFLPTEWMAASHQKLGLGSYPASPLVEYLTRSISALYAVHGAIYLLLAQDVRRYRPVISGLALLNLLFGIVVTGVDLYAGMPWYWTLGEGPPVVVFALLILWLVRRLPE